MSNRIDVMVDIETLGTGSHATIFQISAISFNIETGQHYSTFNGIADVSKNKTLKVDGSTLKWWLNTNKELLTDLLNKGEESSEELLTKFHTWVGSLTPDTKDIYLWGNGILFDNKMIQEQFINLGLNYPIFFRNDRDVRTLVDLAGKKLGITEKELKEKFNDETLVKHDAFDDVKYQINLAVSCYNLLSK